MHQRRPPALTVVGVGADGWSGLSPAAAAALRAADVVIGSARQVRLVEGQVARTETWPASMLDAVPTLLARHPDRRIAVLASGDPMFYGVGATLVRTFGAENVEVIAHPSSVSLAGARLGWDTATVEVVSAVGRPVDAVARALAPGVRLLVLVSEDDGAAQVADVLCRSGYGPSRLTILTRLGGPDEELAETRADGPVPRHDPLAIVAVACVAAPATTALPATPGLPDDAYDSDGALTKREVRALTLAALGPLPGQLLWDVGAGSGSIAIEWMRAHSTCRAVAVEQRADRRERIAVNARKLGVPALLVVAGSAPDALADLEPPDAIFIGGGLTVPGVVEACLAELGPGGRIVANGVTIETETLLAGLHRAIGGALTRIAVSHAGPMGSFTSFRPALPVTQWSYTRTVAP